MDFARQQRNPGKHFVGITFVILLHALVVYAMLTGLAHKAIEVIKQPLETKIIEEIKPPPPPPEIKLPPPPKFVAPPPPYIPPPEVQVQQPPPVAPVITTTTTTPPPEAPPVAPRIEAPPAPPAPAPAPVTNDVRLVCPNVTTVVTELDGRFTRLASKEGITEGEVVVEFTLDASGQLKDVKVVSSTHRALNNLAMTGVRQLSCKGQGQEVRFSQPWVFKIRD